MIINRIPKTVFSLFDQILVSGFNFTLVFTSARNLSDVDMGIMSHFVILYGASLIINNSLIYQKSNILVPHYADPSKFFIYLFSMQVLIATVNVLLLTTLFSLLTGVTEVYIIAPMISYLFFKQLNDFERAKLYLIGSTKSAFILSLATNSIQIVLLITLKPNSLSHTFILILIPTTWVLIRLTQFFKYWNYKRNILFSKNHIVKSKWLMASAGLSFTWARGPIILLGTSVSLSASGTFLAVRSIANIGNVLLGVLQSYYAPKFARTRINGSPKRYKQEFFKVMWIGFGLWLLGLTLFWFLGPQILEIILGTGFSQYNELLIIFWIISLLMFLLGLGLIHFKTIDKDFISTFAYIIGLISLLTIYRFHDSNMVGMAYSILVSNICILAGLIAYQVYTKFKYQWKR